MKNDEITKVAFTIVLVPAALVASWVVGGVGFLMFIGAFVGVAVILTAATILVEALLRRFFVEE